MHTGSMSTTTPLMHACFHDTHTIPYAQVSLAHRSMSQVLSAADACMAS